MIKFKFLSHNRKAKFPPNPEHPDGIDIDLSNGAKLNCRISLPYPAECCGVWSVYCSVCNLNVLVTAAGRADDPRSVKLACKNQTIRTHEPATLT